MKRDNSRFRETVKICGVVLVTAVAVSLAVPVMVGATGSFVTIQDDAANNNANAQVDGGKLRVGDGAGTISIDGTVTAHEGAVSSFRQYFAQLPPNSSSCKPLAVPPAGSAVVLTDIWFNVHLQPGSPGDFAVIATGTCAVPGVSTCVIGPRRAVWGDGHAAWSGVGEQDGLHCLEAVLRPLHHGHRIWLPHEPRLAFRERRRTDHRPLELSGLTWARWWAVGWMLVPHRRR